MSAFTVEDYYNLDNTTDGKIELISGFFEMSPAPKIVHQEVSLELILELGMFFRNHPCKLLEAPCDVKLDDNIVQPDIFVVCDLNKLTDIRCEGIPDLVIEILSTNTKRLDLCKKFKLYEEHELKEYWIVDPEEQWVTQWVLVNGKFQLFRTSEKEGTIDSHLFPDLQIPLATIFKIPRI